MKHSFASIADNQIILQKTLIPCESRLPPIFFEQSSYSVYSMGDPLSIIASAGGIISLGITVCQGLIDYCQAFAGQYRDVRVLVQDLQDLEKSLTSLRDSLTHRPDLLNLVLPYIDRIKGRIEDLQPILGRFEKKVSEEHAFKDKVKTATQRTLYPFKKGTFSKLRDAVRQAQDNLKLALAVVQV